MNRIGIKILLPVICWSLAIMLGLVISLSCAARSASSTNSPTLGVGGESFKTHFVGRYRLAPFLNAWAATLTAIFRHDFTIGHILEVVDNYSPTTEVVLLLESFDGATFFYLKNLPITPPQCDEQVCKTWDEFQPRVRAGQDEQLPRLINSLT